MKMRQTIVLMMVLMAGSSCWAQVRETTTYKDGSYYTGERDAKGRRHGNGPIRAISRKATYWATVHSVSTTAM